MKARTHPHPVSLPRIHELGLELTRTTRRRLLLTLLAPCLATISYFIFASHRVWWLAALSVVALSLLSYGSSSHDLVHRCLGLPKRLNDFLLTVIELLSFRSGTAYRLTHLHHHRRFPHPDDIEASAGRAGVLAALVRGPMHQARLWLWAWTHYRPHRLRLALEASMIAAGLAAAVLLAAHGHWVFPIYAALTIAGSWVFPLVTVVVPHNPTASSPLTQTRLFRGWFFDLVGAGHLYHLEHHLYPMVPHHHWRSLAKKLDPFFHAAGIEAYRVG